MNLSPKQYLKVKLITTIFEFFVSLARHNKVRRNHSWRPDWPAIHLIWCVIKGFKFVLLLAIRVFLSYSRVVVYQSLGTSSQWLWIFSPHFSRVPASAAFSNQHSHFCVVLCTFYSGAVQKKPRGNLGNTSLKLSFALLHCHEISLRSGH